VPEITLLLDLWMGKLCVFRALTPEDFKIRRWRWDPASHQATSHATG